jgi:hypothetical protein
MSTKPTIVPTLNNREEEIEQFRDLAMTKFHALWKELQFQQRLTRGLSKDELLHLTLSCVNDFAAEVTVAELELSKEDFMEVMGESFDDAMASLEFEDNEDDEEDKDVTIPETSTTLQSLIDDPLGKPAPAKDSQP